MEIILCRCSKWLEGKKPRRRFRGAPCKRGASPPKWSCIGQQLEKYSRTASMKKALRACQWKNVGKKNRGRIKPGNRNSNSNSNSSNRTEPTNKQTNKQASKQANKQASKQAGRQAGMQASKQANSNNKQQKTTYKQQTTSNKQNTNNKQQTATTTKNQQTNKQTNKQTTKQTNNYRLLNVLKKQMTWELHCTTKI